ncbi:MAG: FeoB-associated Cys-rich membrane protein [Ruminiclostridium sp.]|nr:FeoB-associated Cys-rich membrane protein [Ruminiclostridium sp.]MBR6563116.1 FeoB-associated Cys-rich membrane protein [Clostridia bacterium]
MYVDVIVSVILIAIIGGIVAYIVKAKKRGEKCIGCPYAKQCGGKCNGGCGTSNENKK